MWGVGGVVACGGLSIEVATLVELALERRFVLRCSHAATPESLFQRRPFGLSQAADWVRFLRRPHLRLRRSTPRARSRDARRRPLSASNSALPVLRIHRLESQARSRYRRSVQKRRSNQLLETLVAVSQYRA